jgi:hypothetical protein
VISFLLLVRVISLVNGSIAFMASSATALHSEFRGGGVVGGDSISAVVLSLVPYTIQANIELSSPLVHAQN